MIFRMLLEKKGGEMTKRKRDAGEKEDQITTFVFMMDGPFISTYQ